jgi:adenylosuccinate synthase
VPAIVIVGSQWGDEGKGKFVDVLTERADWVVRFQGGSNAGHTIVIDGVKTALSLLPSGILRPGVKCLLGAGVVLNPAVLIAEMERLRVAGGEISPARLVIDRDAHLVLDYHVAIDKAREAQRGANRIGTTGKGIGPAYEDRSQRSGIRCADLLHLEGVRARVLAHVEEKNKILRHVLASDSEIEFEPLWKALEGHAAILAPYIGNGSSVTHEALRDGQNVIFEGAQGVLLDQVHGTYPFVTSSSTIAGSAAIGVGVGPRMIDSVVGLAKAYTTRVGEGPFPTEIEGGVGDELRSKGHEYGTVTGRPRRCGWFDAVALRRAVRISGIDSLIVTKLDVLSGQPSLKICTGYRSGSHELNDFPALAHEFRDLEPQYVEMPGWQEDITQVRSWSELPKAAREYVRELERLVGCPVHLVSVGPGREATIPLSPSPILQAFLGDV